MGRQRQGAFREVDARLERLEAELERLAQEERQRSARGPRSARGVAGEVGEDEDEGRRMGRGHITELGGPRPPLPQPPRARQPVRFRGGAYYGAEYPPDPLTDVYPDVRHPTPRSRPAPLGLVPLDVLTMGSSMTAKLFREQPELMAALRGGRMPRREAGAGAPAPSSSSAGPSREVGNVQGEEDVEVVGEVVEDEEVFEEGEEEEGEQEAGERLGRNMPRGSWGEVEPVEGPSGPARARAFRVTAATSMTRFRYIMEDRGDVQDGERVGVQIGKLNHREKVRSWPDDPPVTGEPILTAYAQVARPSPSVLKNRLEPSFHQNYAFYKKYGYAGKGATTSMAHNLPGGRTPALPVSLPHKRNHAPAWFSSGRGEFSTGPSYSFGTTPRGVGQVQSYSLMLKGEHITAPQYG